MKLAGDPVRYLFGGMRELQIIEGKSFSHRLLVIIRVVIPHAGICGGGVRQPVPPPQFNR